MYILSLKKLIIKTQGGREDERAELRYKDLSSVNRNVLLSVKKVINNVNRFIV